MVDGMNGSKCKVGNNVKTASKFEISIDMI
jgi:hypothetical protein